MTFFLTVGNNKQFAVLIHRLLGTDIQLIRYKLHALFDSCFPGQLSISKEK